MNHQFEAIYGFATAGLSSVVLWVAQVAPTDIAPSLETGGTVGLIGGLTFALVIVWRDRTELVKSLHDSEAARIADAKESLTQWKLDAEKGERSRQEMIRELRSQTAAIKENKP